ncbi:MCE family protein [bacterium]|nr:MCE family protein [bacterium]
MKFKDNIRLYAWIEFFIWFIILCLCIWGYRLYKFEKFKQLPSYQIFMPDVDGMIVGSPVKYMGVQVGYIKNIKLLTNNAYVRFIITEEDLELPQGVIATVEFNGLGGSKSLELYPPDENLPTEKLIVIRSPKRLHDSMNLLNDMFGKIDSIGTKFNHFTEQMGLINKEEKSLKFTPADFSKNIENTDNFVNNAIKNRNEFQKKLKGWKDE